MSSTPYPIEQVVPHGPPMILLDQLDHYDQESVNCSLTIQPDSLFCDGKQIPAWVGIEYMAQTIAAYSGAHARDSGEEVVIGFLVGTRKYQSHIHHFIVGDQLTIHANKVIMGENGLGVFECKILRQDQVVAEANLNVFQPNNPEAFLKESEQ